MTGIAIRSRAMTRNDLPVHQQVLLDAIEDVCGTQFHHTSENLTELMQETRLARGSLLRELHSLRVKGFLSCAWKGDGKSRLWELVPKDDASKMSSS